MAENAGHGAFDTVLAMRHKVFDVDICYGPDTETCGICNMNELSIFEPMSLIRSAVTSATEVATAILRIDDVIGRRGDGQASGPFNRQVS